MYGSSCVAMVIAALLSRSRFFTRWNRRLVYTMNSPTRLPQRPGPYRIAGFGRGGQIEFSHSFTPGEDKYGNKYFLFAIPIEDDWRDALDRITLSGPEGAVTIDSSDSRSLTVVTDRVTGRLRAILRDWTRPLPAVLGDTGGLDVETTRGIVDAVRVRPR